MLRNFFKRAKEVFVDPTADIQRVNCLNLVPATTQVKRLHCNMGDGREGDCLIYLKTAECCRFHDPKYIPLTKEEIGEKVADRQNYRLFKEECLKELVCPKCGHDLIVIPDDDHGLDDGKCPICQKTWLL